MTASHDRVGTKDNNAVSRRRISSRYTYSQVWEQWQSICASNTNVLTVLPLFIYMNIDLLIATTFNCVSFLNSCFGFLSF